MDGSPNRHRAAARRLFERRGLLDRLALLAFALGLAVTVAGCKGGATSSGAAGPGKPGAMGGPAMAFAVETLPVESEEVRFTTSAVGSLEAFERVMVTARVAGVVDAVRFREGESVAAGHVLAEIETQRYTLAVRAARAQLARAQSAESDARTGLARREAAEKTNPGLIRGEEVETWRTRLDTARAEVNLATVSVDQAQLNQRDAVVRAPMAGVIQTRDARTGQYAQPGTLVATLLRRDPLLLRFNVPEVHAAALSAGGEVAFLVTGEATPFTARISHVAGAAEPTSRMVAVVAEVADPEGHLRPGAFAEVNVPLGAPRRAPVIPQSAVRPTERGFLAYVVDGTHAQERILTLGQRTTDGRVEVREGLKAGEKLVVRGAEALRDGAEIRLAAATPAPAAPSRPPEAGSQPGQKP